MKKTLSLILALMMVLVLFAACGEKDPEHQTYEEYMATEDGKDVTILSYVQYKTPYSADYKNASLYLADETGAYYVYRVNFETQADYDAVPVGAKVLVKGLKGIWSGEHEVAEGSATVEVIGKETKKMAAKEIAANATAADLEKDMNKLVAMKGAVVASSSMKDPANSSATIESAFLYKWDGSGSQGDDIYFNIVFNGTTYNFVVETDVSNKDSDAYKAVEALKVGDKIDLEGFMYWYNGAQMQVTACKKAQ